LGVLTGTGTGNDLQFQFHHGTIGRALLASRTSLYEISIPPWYDWEPLNWPKKFTQK